MLAAACAEVGELGENTGSTGSASTVERVANPPAASDLTNLPGDLRGVAVPKADFSGYVKDSTAAIRLGKALFWDMQVGSDGTVACASCHFRGGADPRSKNQLNAGAGGHYSAGRGPNYQLTDADFPLTRLETPGERGAVDTSHNDVVGSQGVHHLELGEADPLGFQVGSTNTRRITGRNAPSVFNAVFNHRQFWDGRAENVFNGVNHVGERDASAAVLRANDPRSNPVFEQVRIANASLASQAVAPIVNDVEMAEPGRTHQDVGRDLARFWRKTGKRLAPVRPLAKQLVDRTDSVLGPLALAPSRGLQVPSYEKLIQEAFREEFWDSRLIVSVDANGNVSFVTKVDKDESTEEYSLMQYNFALIFGIAVQMYEETLVSDDTPWDRFRREHPDANDPALNPWTNENPEHISRLALFGAHLFNDRSRGPTNIRCSNCHESAELTDASVRRVSARGMVRNRDGNVIDRGFNNIGIRPTDDDLGTGASDAFGPLSAAKRLFPGALPESFDGAAVSKGFGIEGAFKIPSLRNVALTAPYFHNGEARTLREAVEFYSRGGNVFPVKQTDGTPIEPLGVPSLSDHEIDAIVAFLESLTDDRVLYRKAPFDHPQLFVANGHTGDHTACTDANGDGLADDVFVEIGAVGAAGGAPIPGFLEEGPFAAND